MLKSIFVFRTLTPNVLSLSRLIVLAQFVIYFMIVVGHYRTVLWSAIQQNTSLKSIVVHTSSKPSGRFNSMNQHFIKRCHKDKMHKNDKKCHFAKYSSLQKNVLDLDGGATSVEWEYTKPNTEGPWRVRVQIQIALDLRDLDFYFKNSSKSKSA